ncbi:MAG: glycosyltransferase family 4 protein [Nitrospira sp.]|nr:glycosyltransferase family 4 protein [Nitrospira sp.]MBS0193351.1 glycosyltransferase family 4 protein [Pseudomonadota bacterium]
MRLLLVADTYPPARISGALQMRDLAHALAVLGHRPLVLVPTASHDAQPGLAEEYDVQVLRVRAPRTKDVGLIRRTAAELVLPWVLLRGLHRSPLRGECWDGIVWYSPTIFLGPLVRTLKRRHGCRTYLILRDLFPDWAVDAGVMRKGLIYRWFKVIERFQYRQADTIGVQTPSNSPLVSRDAPPAARMEVLHNWLAPTPLPAEADQLPSLSKLQGRTIFVYAGNMGIAQDMDAFVALARRMRSRDDVGFLFVGRGSESVRLKELVNDEGFENLLVIKEIDPMLLPALLAHCHVGIVALHPGHRTHNIPGKLLTYLRAGLPVLARVNPDNDLVNLVPEEDIGCVVPGNDPDLLERQATRLADDPVLRKRMGHAGIALAQRMFSPASAAEQIAASFAISRVRMYHQR